MSLLKRLPIRYTGCLHGVQLVNFTVERQEVEPLVPWKLRIRDVGEGRALISLVNVELRGMHPHFLPEALHFGYRHVAFRLLLDDASHNGGHAKGIFFVRSFTDKSLIATGGRLFTDYNLETAQLIATPELLTLRQGDCFLNYLLDENTPPPNEPLREAIGALDRAYAVRSGVIYKTQITRERWPLRPVNCGSFRTNFFQTARLEGAFVVDEPIPYQWLPPQRVR